MDPKINFLLYWLNTPGVSEHHKKYQVVMDQLSSGIQIDRDTLACNLLMNKSITVDVIRTCISGNPHPLVDNFLAEVVTIQYKLSFFKKTKSEDFFYKSGSEFYFNNPHIQSNSIYDVLWNTPVITAPEFHEFAQTFAKQLYTADISAIGQLISYAHISPILTFLGSHHAIVGVVGISAFCLAFNTLESPGHFIIFLKKVLESLNCRFHRQLNFLVSSCVIVFSYLPVIPVDFFEKS